MRSFVVLLGLTQGGNGRARLSRAVPVALDDWAGAGGLIALLLEVALQQSQVLHVGAEGDVEGIAATGIEPITVSISVLPTMRISVSLPTPSWCASILGLAVAGD